ncbi:hypothetical protein ElyMa_001596600 [Elysia marginata]|uniref:Uncharacterized protein n=1 Tax=Elysia marginata TaxID=1093978 RepID=A0AAV4JH10_9GAST|nr:hypothetical protein ElyMa_001596600 [Elysia marginata]
MIFPVFLYTKKIKEIVLWSIDGTSAWLCALFGTGEQSLPRRKETDRFAFPIAYLSSLHLKELRVEAVISFSGKLIHLAMIRLEKKLLQKAVDNFLLTSIFQESVNPLHDFASNGMDNCLR